MATDPTDRLLPSVECESATCRDATEAAASREYARAGELFEIHFDEHATDDDRDGAWLVYAAYAHQQAGAYDDAASLYLRAADKLEPLGDYLLIRSLSTSLEGDPADEVIDRIRQIDALETGYEDSPFLAMKIDALTDEIPTTPAVERALTRGDTDRACNWLIGDLGLDELDDELVELAYGHCIDDVHDGAFDDVDPRVTAETHLLRGEALAADVRFEEALEELDRIGDDELSDVDACRADFRRARSHFRLRRHRTASDIYRGIVERCTDDANEDQRVRSLYALGNRHYQRGELDDSQRYFETLYRDYPERSHADDALFFLARIERQRDDYDREREIELLIEALENYPEEDMIHEMAWEVFEPTFRDGEYRKFIDAVTRLPLPEWDREYFSQGRLEYFVGLAHQRLDEIDDAADYWQLAWVKYPFSFYGYLAHLRLVEHDRTPEPLHAPEVAERVDWFDTDFDGTGADILARAGHLEGACDFERARLDNNDAPRSELWRLATLCHQAGDYPTSHNVARRDISGRPWSMPAAGRLARWHVAWPDPYGDELRAAIDDLGPDSTALAVDPGLASSIMREESAFIEDIISWAGAVGLMQLMPGTAAMHDDAVDADVDADSLERADINIPVGIDHLAELSRSLDGHPVAIVAAYNAGIGRINSWLRRQPNDEIALWVEDIPILQTRDYTKRVIGSYAAYQYLRGVTELDDRPGAPAR